MRSWPAPEVPRLPGEGVPLHVYDSGSRAVRPTDPGPTARMYVCGITPYDATHLGHAATYLAFDLVGRVWRDAGHEVLYVQNVTDVDDPLLERADRDGQDWRELAEREIALFREDMTSLRILPPDHYVGVVGAIPLVAEMISTLREHGAAYEVDGDIYFPVSSDVDFGAVSGLSPAEMLPLFAERGGDPDRKGKKDPLDALLWRAERPGEPAWDSPFGPGRPGWHIECSAISLKYLGMGFDLEGGGSDLTFPHHEMSASHAQVATGSRPHARAYVHAGMVALDGDKQEADVRVYISCAEGAVELPDHQLQRAEFCRSADHRGRPPWRDRGGQGDTESDADLLALRRSARGLSSSVGRPDAVL